MHSNIETTIDRILAEVVDRGVVTDLEPLRIRVICVESRLSTTEQADATRIDEPLEDCVDGADRVEDAIS